MGNQLRNAIVLFDGIALTIEIKHFTACILNRFLQTVVVRFPIFIFWIVPWHVANNELGPILGANPWLQNRIPYAL